MLQKANPAIANLIPYQPGKPIEELARETGLTDIIKLASNENPLGASQKVQDAIKQALNQIHFYPDGGCYELKNVLSRFYNLPLNYFTIGNGSENILELIVKAYLLPGEEAIISQYAFATIPLLLKSFGAKIITVPVKNWEVDCDALLAAITSTTKIVFIVNPNNPTGTYIARNNLERILKNISSETLIVMDEAYNEYIDAPDYTDALPYLAQYPNLIITRTFSKVYGLAGLRMGYAVSHAAVADILNRARLPFNINLIGATAAIAALQDQAHVQQSKKLNTAGMQQLITGLRKLNLEFIPSVANFITVNVNDAEKIYQKLLAKGVIVRPLISYGMPAFVRISIGTQVQNARLLTALSEVLA